MIPIARPVAIVGMSARSPTADDLTAYWEGLVAGAPDASLRLDAAEPNPSACENALVDAGIDPQRGAGVPCLAPITDAIQNLALLQRDIVLAGADDGSTAFALVLKRLEDARRSGDRIYAVIHRMEDSNPRLVPAHTRPAAGYPGLVRQSLALFHRVIPPAHESDQKRYRPWVQNDPDSPRTAIVLLDRAPAPPVCLVLQEFPERGLEPGPLRTWETESILLAASDRGELISHAQTILSQLERSSSRPFVDLAFEMNQAMDPFKPARLGLVASSCADLKDRLQAAIRGLLDPRKPNLRDGRGVYYFDQPLIDRPGRLAFLFPGEGSQYPGMMADLALHFPEVVDRLDIADRIACELGEAILPSDQLFASDRHGTDGLWDAATAVNVVLSVQWAMYQLLRKLGLSPDVVAGHSSGELLALAAAGALAADRRLENALARLGAIFRDFERSGEIPAARLVAIAAGRDQVEALCHEIGRSDLRVAMDNCPHQVVLAGSPEAVECMVSRLARLFIPCEVLPFERAYHTPDFEAVMEPVAKFLNTLEWRAPAIPIFSCAIKGRMSNEPRVLRAQAEAQWTRSVDFRETVLAMHDAGVRVFVDVGARGNLAGFVDDTLRGKPSFAIAANLPRRSGITQLNHLTAALFAHGARVDWSFLHARRRPRQVSSAPTSCPLDDAGVTTALIDYQQTMRRFLAIQREVVCAHLASASSGVEDLEDFTFDWADEPDSEALAPAAERSPGPWLGRILEHIPARELISRYTLDPVHDPIARHHTLGGRRTSALDSNLKGLPVVPFAMMAEMAAEAGAILASPDFVLTSLADVIARKWVIYERDLPVLEIRAQRLTSTRDERVAVRIHNRGSAGRDELAQPIFEAVATFEARAREPQSARPWRLANARPGRFTAHTMYDEGWLFHGPPLQATSRMGMIGPQGIDADLRVLPFAPLVRSGQPATFQHDVIILDTFTHILGAWGLDWSADEGDVMFPLSMALLELEGARPAEGTNVSCRIAIEHADHHRIRARAEIVRPDGTVWMRIQGWEDWRFHWPGRYRDAFRQANHYLVAEPLATAIPAGSSVVWLEPPLDMTRPVWRDVLEQTQLCPGELERQRALGDRDRTRRLFAAVAAKDAMRRVLLARGLGERFPVDLEFVAESPTGTHVRDLGHADLRIAVAVATAPEAAIAIASLDPDAKPAAFLSRIDGGETFNLSKDQSFETGQRGAYRYAWSLGRSMQQ